MSDVVNIIYKLQRYKHVLYLKNLTVSAHTLDTLWIRPWDAGTFEGCGAVCDVAVSHFTGLDLTTSETEVQLSLNLATKRICNTFQLEICETSVSDGPLSLASISQSISVTLKCFLQTFFMFSRVASHPKWTMVSGPIRAYFWHFPSTVNERCCTVM